MCNVKYKHEETLLKLSAVKNHIKFRLVLFYKIIVHISNLTNEFYVFIEVCTCMYNMDPVHMKKNLFTSLLNNKIIILYTVIYLF